MILCPPAFSSPFRTRAKLTRRRVPKKNLTLLACRNFLGIIRGNCYRDGYLAILCRFLPEINLTQMYELQTNFFSTLRSSVWSWTTVNLNGARKSGDQATVFITGASWMYDELLGIYFKISRVEVESISLLASFSFFGLYFDIVWMIVVAIYIYVL